MARIRTVKPEFWTDDDVLEFSDSCALFFIAIWNFCDDEGKIKNQPRTIAKLTARWSPEKVQVFLRSLTASGQLRLSLCSAWLQVVNWSHQRINRPIQPKIKASEIQWVTEKHSVNTHDKITDQTPQGKEGKGVGEERSGVDEHTPDKLKIFEEIFSDEKFVTDMTINHPGKDLKKAFEECWLYHIQKPSPPEHAWMWRQKLNTWLIGTKISNSNGFNGTPNKKQQHSRKLAEAVVKTYSDVFNGGQNGRSDETSPVNN